MADDPYVYPGTNVLRNRFGLCDGAQLAQREARITTARTIELVERPIFGDYDLKHLQAFHRHIFGDVYPWAGQIRSVPIAKDDLFALPEHIEPYLSDVLRRLPAERHLRGLAREPFVDRLTHYLAVINSVHPFREGNGRAQRAFLQQLSDDAGYHLDWTRLDPVDNIQVSQAAHRGDDQPMRTMLDRLTVGLEQQQAADLYDAARPSPNRPGRSAASSGPGPSGPARPPDRDHHRRSR